MPFAPCRFLRVLSVAAVACLALPSPAQSSQAQLPKEVTAILNQQVWWDSAAPSKTNPKGLHFQFIRVDEVARDGKNYVRYRVRLAGAPEGERLLLQTWKIGTALKDMVTISPEIYVNGKGLLMTRKPRPEQQDKDSAENDGEALLDVRAARGEPARFVLSNDARDFLVTGAVVPYPIEGKVGNCRI